MRSSTGRDRLFPTHDNPTTCMRTRSAIRSFSWPSCISGWGGLLRETSLRSPELAPTCSPREENSTPQLPAPPALPLPPWRVRLSHLGNPWMTPPRPHGEHDGKPLPWPFPVVCPQKLRGTVSQYAPQIMQQSSHVTTVRLSRCSLSILQDSLTKFEPRSKPRRLSHARVASSPSPQRTC